MPAPILVSPPLPTMLPASVSAFACVSTVPVPLSVIALASESPLAAACRVVPFAKVRSPVPNAVLDPTASVPALTIVPPVYVFAPVSVSVPVPTFTREARLPPELPPSWIVPLTVVERLLPPTVSWLEPSEYVPAPAIEPAVIWLFPAGPEVPEKSTVPDALVMNWALPPVLLPKNWVLAPLLVVMVALAALLVSANCKRTPPPLLVITAELAEVPFWKNVPPLLVIVVMPEVLELSTNRRALLTTLPTIEPVVPESPSCSVPNPLMVVPPVYVLVPASSSAPYEAAGAGDASRKRRAGVVASCGERSRAQDHAAGAGE